MKDEANKNSFFFKIIIFNLFHLYEKRIETSVILLFNLIYSDKMPKNRNLPYSLNTTETESETRRSKRNLQDDKGN